MRIVQRAQKRIFLVIASKFADPGLGNELAIKLIPLLETRWAHARGRADAFHGFLGICDNERAIFAAQKTRGMKRFQFFAFAQIEALADVDERGDGRILWPESASDDRADMGRSDGLRRRVT